MCYIVIAQIMPLNVLGVFSLTLGTSWWIFDETDRRYKTILDP